MPTTHLNYQQPPSEIIDLVDVPRAPFVQMDRKGRYLLLFHRNQYAAIQDLCQDEMRLAGIRVNPNTNINSRQIFYHSIEISYLEQDKKVTVNGLPDKAQLSNFVWSPSQQKLAFSHTSAEGTELWYLDLESAQVVALTKSVLNANLGQPFCWFPQEDALLAKVLPANRSPLLYAAQTVPTGPRVAETDGLETQNRTYQDLLKNEEDAHNFETLGQANLCRVSLNGICNKWLDTPALYKAMVFSPDGNYVRISKIERPFSYKVPHQRFAQQSTVYTLEGTALKIVQQLPLSERIPKGFMSVRTGSRHLQWRADLPATLAWVEALDGGDAQQKVAFRDELWQWHAPFEAAPQRLQRTEQRFLKIQWGDAKHAIIHDYWWNTRNTKTYLFDPSIAHSKTTLLFDRDYQDQYADPGDFVQKRNQYAKYVLDIDQNSLLLVGEGHSKEGQFPFIDRLNIRTASTERLYQSVYKDKLEKIFFPLEGHNLRFVVRIESATEYPNYYLRNIGTDARLQSITNFKNPFKAIQSVHKELIQYQRSDGLELSANLYLPIGYKKEDQFKKPLIIWAYPREYKDSNTAGQSRTNPNEFTYPFYGSPIYWLTRGYVVLDDAAFPILGEKDSQPNDTFIEQLSDNARSAIDAVDKRGYIDRNKVAIGGHSYGAFMTANLLTHTKLFAAGIARSGAYNRSLTPFGFQSEERNYWEATEVYQQMSPFVHAHKMKTPLLLIHGESDNNSGTYPMQSERYFDALKALGATARLVILPKESHGYVAKESILHLLWEQDQWLEKYVKNKAE